MRELCWLVVDTMSRSALLIILTLPAGLQAQLAGSVRDLRLALAPSFAGERMGPGIDRSVASGYTGQKLETLALRDESSPFERIVGVPLKTMSGYPGTIDFGVRAISGRACAFSAQPEPSASTPSPW